jgi:hypothetical protein
MDDVLDGFARQLVSAKAKDALRNDAILCPGCNGRKLFAFFKYGGSCPVCWGFKTISPERYAKFLREKSDVEKEDEIISMANRRKLK